MTKEEWKQAEEALTHFFHPVELKVDGYDITLILERVGVYQNKIMVYIGGEFRGQWMAEDCDERRRFLQERKEQPGDNGLPGPSRRPGAFSRRPGLSGRAFLCNPAVLLRAQAPAGGSAQKKPGRTNVPPGRESPSGVAGATRRCRAHRAFRTRGVPAGARRSPCRPGPAERPRTHRWTTPYPRTRR